MGLVVAGDVAYNGIHPYLADTTPDIVSQNACWQKIMGQPILLDHPRPVEELRRLTKQENVINNCIHPMVEIERSSKIIDKVMIAKRQVDRNVQVLDSRKIQIGWQAMRIRKCQHHSSPP